MNAETDTVVRRQNHYFADEAPTQIEVAYAPWPLVEGSVISYSTKRGTGSLYARFEELGHTVARSREEVSARMPIQDEAAILGTPPGVPVLDVLHTSIDQDGVAFEVTRFTMRADCMALDYNFPQRIPMTELLIRPREDADIPACAAVLIAVHAVDGYPVEGVSEPEAWLWPDGIIQAWVAELDGRVVGHALLTRPGPGDAAAELWTADHPGDHMLAVGGRLFVHPDARGRSLGGKLMTAAAEYARSTGFRVVLDVMQKDRAAIQLYDKLGLERIGTTQHPDGHGNMIPAICYASPWPQLEPTE